VTRHILPYGSWPSPFSVEKVVAGSRSLREVWLDGGDLYFLEGRPEDQGRVVLMRRSSDGSLADVTPPGFNVRTRAHEYGGGAYTVHEGTIVFSHLADGRLYLQPSPASGAEPLTGEGELRFADMRVDAMRRRIVSVVEDHSGGSEDPANTIAAISLRDGSISQLVWGRDFFSDPRLDPSGARMAWLAWDRPNMPWDGTELWIAELDADGVPAARRRIVGGPDESIVGPTWAPDGSLVFASDRTGWWNLYRWRDGTDAPEALAPMEAELAGPQWVFGLSTFAIESDGSVLAVARSGGRDRLLRLAPGRSPAEVPVDATDLAYLTVRDGVCAFVAHSPTAPSAVVRLDLASGALERVREAAHLDMDASWLSLPRHLEFPTAGGRTAFAFFYPPTNPEASGPEGERPPLVVMSHGGPTSHTDAGLSLTVQAWTSRGMAVVDVDYGGSTGYGREYRDRLRGSWGVVDVEDCLNAARFLAGQGLVDPARMAIRGGSAGGSTTLAALCQGDVFAAGATYFGVCDMEALARHTHKFESRYLDSLIAPWPEGVARYRERSPIHFVERIRSPVLVLQGTEDMVVPRAQSDDIVAALDRRGIPNAYLLFEGEGHGFRRAENQRRAFEAELSFYAQVLGFELADDIEPIEVRLLDAWRARRE
jgi:dipeptidyl aminopeptidase/acylaminoacyl peptidase